MAHMWPGRLPPWTSLAFCRSLFPSSTRKARTARPALFRAGTQDPGPSRRPAPANLRLQRGLPSLAPEATREVRCHRGGQLGLTARHLTGDNTVLSLSFCKEYFSNACARHHIFLKLFWYVLLGQHPQPPLQAVQESVCVFLTESSTRSVCVCSGGQDGFPCRLYPGFFFLSFC